MNAPYGFDLMSKQYREEALRDAQRQHLEARLRAHRRVDPERSRADLALGRTLWSVLRGARLVGQTAGRSEE
jgi:hypothetical protein